MIPATVPTSAGAPALALSGLAFAWPGSAALRLPDLELAPGEACALLGPSGCGKTTLLHLAAGLLRPQAGTVRVAGTDLATLAPAAADRFRGRHVGLVFQRLHLLSALTVRENLLAAQRFAGVAVDADAAGVLLQRLGLADKAGLYPATLSQGEAQRLAIARAVVQRPALLLADEPTSSLDDANAAAALSLLLEQAQAVGAALLVVTHDERVARRIPRQLRMGGGAA